MPRSDRRLVCPDASTLMGLRIRNYQRSQRSLAGSLTTGLVWAKFDDLIPGTLRFLEQFRQAGRSFESLAMLVEKLSSEARRTLSALRCSYPDLREFFPGNERPLVAGPQMAPLPPRGFLPRRTWNDVGRPKSPRGGLMSWNLMFAMRAPALCFQESLKTRSISRRSGSDGNSSTAAFPIAAPGPPPTISVLLLISMSHDLRTSAA